jgi:hypothetical protein
MTPEEKLAALRKEKEELKSARLEDARQHAELKAVYETACADNKLEYAQAHESDSLWWAAHAAAVKDGEHAQHMNKNSERLQRIAVDIWALNVAIEALELAERRRDELANFK